MGKKQACLLLIMKIAKLRFPKFGFPSCSTYNLLRGQVSPGSLHTIL